MNSNIGNCAVVLGGSLTGVLAAAVLAESYTEVLVVDRDTVLGVGTARKGAPHAIHAHALHARGHQILEEMFPGLTAGLVDVGVPTCDYGEMHWYMNGQRLRSSKTGLISVMAPRPKLEEHIRARVATLPNVTFLERHDILSLIATSSHDRIVGVRVSSQDDANEERTLHADLVIDATGRGSRSPAWLEELGYQRPQEERMKIGLAYTTRHYEMYPGMLDGIPSINSIATPRYPRGGFFGKIGPNLCNLSLTGIMGDHPPTEAGAFLEYARSLPVPQIYEVVKNAKPIMDPVRFNYPSSVRKRYEHLMSFPEGYLVMGDAVCSFNPVYGQGMSASAMEAMSLQKHLRQGVAPNALKFFSDVSNILDTPWEISAGGDLAFPGVEGPRTFKVRLGTSYMDRLQYAATKDAKVTTGFMRVAGLLDPPTALMRPGMVSRVLRRSLRKPAWPALPTKPVKPEELHFAKSQETL